MLGLGSTPFAIGFGYQYGPLIRNEGNGVENRFRLSRFNFLFSIDIPLLNIYVRPH